MNSTALTTSAPEINDFRAFEATPGIAVILLPDTPVYTHVAVSNDFILESGMKREEVIGKGHFDLFPKSPDDPNFTGEQNLKNSFVFIIQNKQPHQIPLQRYDIPAGDGTFSQRYWKISNAPILNDVGEVMYIVHSAVDITDRVLAEQRESTISESEKRFRTLAQNSPDLITRHGADFRYLYISPLIEQLSGLKPEEFIGKSYRELPFPEELCAFFDEHLRIAFQTKKIHHCEYTVFAEKETHMFSRLVPEFDEDGVMTSVLVISTDVTERKKWEKALQESEKRFRQIANTLPLVIWTAAPDGNLTYISAQWEEAYGNPVAESLGDGWADFVHPDDIGRAAAAWTHSLTTGEIYETEFRVLHKSGEYRWILVRAIPIRDSENKIESWYGSNTDIEDKKRFEEALKQEEEQFRSLANSITQLAWIADAEGWIHWYNERWFEYTGTTLEEMKGWGWEKVHHPDHVERVVSFAKEAWQNSEPWELVFPLRRYDGEYRWFLTRGVPVKDNEGKVMKWIGTNTDIEEQKKSEASLESRVNERTTELQNQKNLLDNILTNSSNGISVTEMIRNAAGEVMNTRTIMANDAAVQFTGLPKEVYLSKTATDIDPDMLRSPYGQACLKTLHTGEPSFIQYFLEMTGRWLELTISKMDEDHLIHIFTDVTLIKEAQLQLERLVDDLRGTNQNLEEFAYAASHDMKEPIRKILFFADRLKKDLQAKLTDNQRLLFEKVEKAALRMGTLIDDLLVYSQATKGIGEQKEIDLFQKVKTVLEDLELEVLQKGATVTVGPLPTIKGNLQQFRQLFHNLLSNALKYAKTDLPPEVTITSQIIVGKEVKPDLPLALATKSFHLIEVKDNGIGFPAEDAERIFHVFTRLHGNAEYKGTGVGLSIAQKVVHNHGGLIWAESRPGEGATFKVLLPVE